MNSYYVFIRSLIIRLIKKSKIYIIFFWNEHFKNYLKFLEPCTPLAVANLANRIRPCYRFSYF